MAKRSGSPNPASLRAKFRAKITADRSLFFIGFRRGGKVCLFLILYWCSAFAESWDGPNILGPNSRNSRFGGRKFAFRVTTGIRRQPVDLLESLLPRNDTFVGKSKEFPAQREKPGFWARRGNYIGRPGLASRSGVPVSASRRSRAEGAQRSPYCWCQAWIWR